MPEELKGLLRAVIRDQERDREVMLRLEKQLTRLADRYRRSKLERVAIIVVLLASIVLFGLYVVDALQRRADVRQQLHDLACLAVRRTPAGVSGTVDDLRNKYDCPPYVAAPAPKGAATSTAPREPGATVTVTSTRVSPGPVRTVSLAGPTVTATRTVTRTVTHTVHPATRTVTATKPVARCLPVPVRIC